MDQGKVESTVLDDYLTENEFIEQAKARGMKMTRRTLRKWRQKRLLPYTKINNMILIPKNWSSELKVTKARHASA
jgi:hypothetical protein